jgi:hypothetical protein
MAGRDSQGAWRQDEVIGGKPPVVKQLWLWIWLWAERNWESSDAGYSPDREDLRAGSWRISTVSIRYQDTAIEDTAGWGRLSVCSSDL